MYLNDKLFFTNPGYRGLEIIKYPVHVKNMIKEVNAMRMKNNSEIKNNIYKGFELQIN